MRLLVVLLFAVFSFQSNSHARAAASPRVDNSPVDSGGLPEEVREELKAVRSACGDTGAKQSADPLAGIRRIKIKTTEYLVSFAADACESYIKGNGVCTTDGCELPGFREK
jgi:hypothetical protein